jgi:hypothetical protein
MYTYNTLPEYCQHGYLVGAIATLIHSTNIDLANWFIVAYNTHCKRFLPNTFAQLHLVKDFWSYVLSILASKLNLCFNAELMALNNTYATSFDEWMAMFDQYILPIIKNNIDHILEVK